MIFKKSENGIFFRFEDATDGPTIYRNQHYHNVFEIYFLERGSCRYFVNDKSYEATAGDVILIPEGTIHKTIYEEGVPHSRRLIYCSTHYIPTTVVEDLPSMLYLYRNPNVTKQITEIFDKIQTEYTAPDEFSEDVILSYTHLLFYYLARNINSKVETKSRNMYALQAIAYIKEHFSSEITLTSLAKMNSMSPEHFSRVFKRETGFGFSEYLTMVRLQKAEQMLKSSERFPISQIAYDCGFNDSNYFSEKFKQVYGMPPMKYRKR
ncbi:MAG: helix-turn-helix transcriptional regulator [Clostridia bacterium]|nr:helix-turn-helix transcriptional regulator [Clostridia bacterium]